MRSFPVLFRALADLLGVHSPIVSRNAHLVVSCGNVRLLCNCCRGQRSEHELVQLLSAPFRVSVAVRNLPDLSAHRKMACHFSLVCTLGKIGKPSSLCTRQVGKGRDTREFKSTFETTGAQPEAARLCCFSAVPCWVSWVDVGVSGRSPDVAKRQRMSRFPAFVKPDVGRHLVCRAKP